MASDNALNVDSVIEAIKNISKIKDIAEKDVNGLKYLVSTLLSDWSRNMCELCADNRYDDADRIAEEITQLFNDMPEVFPQGNPGFLRDQFDVEDHTVYALQYYKPLPFYQNSPAFCSLTKYILFQVNRGEDIVIRYYLESSELMGLFYVLCTMSPGCHAQVQPYGDYKPSYKEMKDVIVQHLPKYLKNRAPTSVASTTNVNIVGTDGGGEGGDGGGIMPQISPKND